MSGPRARPLFVDTSALYAHLDENVGNHDRARAVFEAIRAGNLRYRPLYVTSHVLGELVTLVIHNSGPAAAIDALDRLLDSSLFETLHPGPEDFEAASGRFARHDDQYITLVDHLTARMANDRDVGQVFTFDDDFRTFGFTLVPSDVSVP